MEIPAPLLFICPLSSVFRRLNRALPHHRPTHLFSRRVRVSNGANTGAGGDGASAGQSRRTGAHSSGSWTCLDTGDRTTGRTDSRYFTFLMGGSADPGAADCHRHGDGPGDARRICRGGHGRRTDRLADGPGLRELFRSDARFQRAGGRPVHGFAGDSFLSGPQRPSADHLDTGAKFFRAAHRGRLVWRASGIQCGDLGRPHVRIRTDTGAAGGCGPAHCQPDPGCSDAHRAAAQHLCGRVSHHPDAGILHARAGTALPDRAS